MTISRIVPQWEPVSLPELVNTAELLTRVDRKYLLREHDAFETLARAATGSRVLEIEKNRIFRYESVYFDTPDHLSYRLTALSRRRRFKLRTRCYVDTGGTYLELKTKNGRGATTKERTTYDPPSLGHLTSEGKRFLNTLFEQHRLPTELIERFAPSLISRYQRTTLLMPDGSRATIDTELNWANPQNQGIMLPGYVILESKSAGAPSPLDLALWHAGHRPSRISKFGTGTAALNPDLPRNKWARTLQGPFSAALPAPRH